MEQNNFKKSDFIITENYHTRLKKDTANLLIDAMRLNFALKIPYKSGKNYQYPVILEDNVQQLAKHILDKTKNFEIVIPEISLQRNDVVSLRKKIELMTPDERKEFGINKSTLWHIKKNLKNNKSFKIYDKMLAKIK